MKIEKNVNKPTGIFLYQQLRKDFYGLGEVLVIFLCNQVSVSPYLRITFISQDQFTRIYSKVSNFLDANFLYGLLLKRNLRLGIVRKVNIRCYQGLRFKYGLPTKGQRTHSNGKTAKRFNRKKF